MVDEDPTGAGDGDGDSDPDADDDRATAGDETATDGVGGERDDGAPQGPAPPEDPIDPTALLPEREARLDGYLAESGMEAVWFATHGGFAWATGGGDNRVSRTDDGVGAVGYDADGDWHLVANNVEADRLATEELVVDATVHEVPWHESTLPEAVAAASPTPAAADVDVPGLASVDPTRLRLPLVEGDIERFRALGRATARVVESIAREIDPEDTESSIAAGLRAALEVRDLSAPVVLVGGDERLQTYRHFTPKPVPVGDYAVVSVTAEWKGLHASCTRTVAFDSPEWLDHRHTVCMFMEATALGATHAAGTAGNDAGAVFRGIQAGYEHFDAADEWREHHQGGPAGYAGREWLVAPEGDQPVELPGAFAYNPSFQGAKSEDTVLVTEDGLEILTFTGDWPATAVDGYDYDVVLERPQVLVLDD
jgi:Xaa-Pro aminopeptidase